VYISSLHIVVLTKDKTHCKASNNYVISLQHQSQTVNLSKKHKISHTSPIGFHISRFSNWKQTQHCTVSKH